jgi:hypothetical protein
MSNINIPGDEIEAMKVVHQMSEMHDRICSLEATEKDWQKLERLAHRYLGWVRDSIEGLNTDERSN